MMAVVYDIFIAIQTLLACVLFSDMLETILTVDLISNN